MAAVISPALRSLLAHIRSLSAAMGAPAYIVGGSVRDALLGMRVADLDIALDGDAFAFADALAASAGGVAVTRDALRRASRIVVPLDGKGAPHAQVDVTELKAPTVERDLALRDFTVNAMAVPVDAFGERGWRSAIIDPLSGARDLADGALRLASPSALSDDPSRLLRAVRIAFARGLRIDGATVDALRRDAHLLPRVAPERLQEEMLKLLDVPEPGDALLALDDARLLTTLVPELEAGRDCTQPKEHYWNVLPHGIHTVGFAERVLRRDGLPAGMAEIVPWSREIETRFHGAAFAHGHPRATFLKLAALLHDAAKPATKAPDATGRVRFLGHPERGAEMARDILRRLRFSNLAVEHVRLMVAEHLRPSQLAPHGRLPSRRATWKYYRDLEGAAVDTVYLSLADYLAARGPLVEFPRWRERVRIATCVLEGHEARGAVAKARRVVDGHDLMRALGLPPGPALGRLLDAVHEAVGAGDISTKRQALALAKRLMKSNATAPVP
ncbi:MAG: HD domain-containing protein [SAR202 cluster bacterium]|nr:HD domain-containing protein [SAR202 cluster bacterium]